MSTGSGTSGRIIHHFPLSNHASSINAPVFGSPTAISCSHSLSHSQPSHLNNSIPSTSGNTTNVKKRSASRNQTPLLARSGKLAGTLNQQLYTDLVESQAAELAEVTEEVRTLRQENHRISDHLAIIQDGHKKHAALERQLSRAKSSLECPICFSVFHGPYFCGHTICVTCLQSWFTSITETQDDDSLLRVNSCPICRQPCLVPTPAYVVRDLIDQLDLTPSNDTLGMARFVAASSGDPNEVAWEGYFIEEIETCESCGGLARDGRCLGYSGIYGIDMPPADDGPNQPGHPV
ncbi:hypothetical protein SISNIDRAFT_239343 [Sistotremastrum niveocremeum HHB9708]|uniref:RING-type domain-containing protein n=1 Tax=Sistotremastrum niveocremeum HHB9708 TaxID=1314777 RepID=A0A164PM72_9AGAM|nr:hypothetical protein SISNIDRAFT_239343 [Sistotremastrum niveocremeum HHB9708]